MAFSWTPSITKSCIALIGFKWYYFSFVAFSLRPSRELQVFHFLPNFTQSCADCDAHDLSSTYNRMSVLGIAS